MVYLPLIPSYLQEEGRGHCCDPRVEPERERAGQRPAGSVPPLRPHRPHLPRQGQDDRTVQGIRIHQLLQVRINYILIGVPQS